MEGLGCFGIIAVVVAIILMYHFVFDPEHERIYENHCQTYGSEWHYKSKQVYRGNSIDMCVNDKGDIKY